MNTILQAENIQKTYGTKNNSFQALKNINLEVAEGEFVGIMGPSGAGKSTLLQIISTIDTPSSGSITIAGQNISQMKENELADFRRDQLGFVFQDYNLLDTLTVKENIVLPLALAKRAPDQIAKQVEEIADTFGIREILDKYPYQISGGQKQRTAASRAIITKPSLILADEPTGALDSKSAASLLQRLGKLNEENKATILMVTHDAFAASFSQRILFIKDGVIDTEIRKGEKTREAFFQDILANLSLAGGEE